MVEAHHKVWHMDVVVWDPTVVSDVVTFPFDEVLQSMVPDSTIENVLDLILFFSAH